nr:TIGR02117 family protein [Pseudomonas sp.]
MIDKEAGTPHRIWRILRAALLTLLALPSLYLLGAVAGAWVPRNANWEEPSHGVLVFVRSNGVHVDLVLPAVSAGHDLYRWVPPEHVAGPGTAQGWIAFGWGQREFYLETPHWSDLTVVNAARAVFGGDAVMHVEHVHRPRPSADTRPLRLEQQAYSRLVAHIANSFAVGSDGRPVPLVETGYGHTDIFYEATGHYSAIRTSNQWASDVMAGAGVKVGVWTPFAQGIMWRFRSAAEPDVKGQDE